MAEKFTLSEVEIDFDSCIYEGSVRSCRIYNAEVKDGGTPVKALAKVTFRPTQTERRKLFECAEIHRMLHDHPNVLKILGVLQTKEYFALIFEVGEGECL